MNKPNHAAKAPANVRDAWSDSFRTAKEIDRRLTMWCLSNEAVTKESIGALFITYHQLVKEMEIVDGYFKDMDGK
jgi:hypothetical protein